MHSNKDNDSIMYKSKYLKYKAKYFRLKQEQKGGLGFSIFRRNKDPIVLYNNGNYYDKHLNILENYNIKITLLDGTIINGTIKTIKHKSEHERDYYYKEGHITSYTDSYEYTIIIPVDNILRTISVEYILTMELRYNVGNYNSNSNIPPNVTFSQGKYILKNNILNEQITNISKIEVTPP